MSSSPGDCEHANEVPYVCVCPSSCYCKENTCKQNPSYARYKTLYKEPNLKVSVSADRQISITCFTKDGTELWNINQYKDDAEVLIKQLQWAVNCLKEEGKNE